MALLSNNGGTIQLNQNKKGAAPVTQTEHTSSNATDHFLFSNLFNTLPRWDSIKTSSGPVNVPQNTYIQQENQNDDFPLRNSLGAIGSVPSSSLMSHHDLMGGISLTPSTSPQTSSSTSSHGISTTLGALCGRCETHASNRCLDCNDILCEDCAHQHHQNSFTRDHCLIPMSTLSPIGSSVNISNGSNGQSSDPQCDVHGEILR